MPPLSGVGRATFELCRRIFRPGDDWTPLYYYGWYTRNLLDLESTGSVEKKFKSRALKTALSVVRSNDLLKRAARGMLEVCAGLGSPKDGSPRLYWEPNHVILQHLEARFRLLTLHDLSCLRHPEWHPRERLDFFNSRFLPGIQRADGIVTVSEAIRREVMNTLKLPEDRVICVHNGVDRERFRPLPGDELERFRLERGLREGFVLCVGSLEPRKNLTNLLDGWLSLPKRLRSGYRLLLIGNAGWSNEDVMKKIRENGDSILLRSDVPAEDLPRYYNLAEFFVCVSLYEGFSLPPLEALACGTPVLASDIAVHREILRDGAVYVNPGSAAKIAEALEVFLTAPPDRGTARKKGVERAGNFTWEAAALQYRSIMKNFLEESGI
jgi:glycosyltransferase involved in cell wall biosynthesis